MKRKAGRKLENKEEGGWGRGKRRERQTWGGVDGNIQEEEGEEGWEGR